MQEQVTTAPGWVHAPSEATRRDESSHETPSPPQKNGADPRVCRAPDGVVSPFAGHLPASTREAVQDMLGRQFPVSEAVSHILCTGLQMPQYTYILPMYQVDRLRR